MNTEQVTEADLSVELSVAWSKVTNMVYVIGRIKDDIVNADKLKFGDAVHVNINPNRVSGKYWIGGTYKLLGFNVFEPIFSPAGEWTNTTLTMAQDGC